MYIIKPKNLFCVMFPIIDRTIVIMSTEIFIVQSLYGKYRFDQSLFYEMFALQPNYLTKVSMKLHLRSIANFLKCMNYIQDTAFLSCN